MNDFEKLKTEIKTWYPDETFTDAELNEMTNKLIKFFAIGAKITFESQKDKNNH